MGQSWFQTKERSDKDSVIIMSTFYSKRCYLMLFPSHLVSGQQDYGCPIFWFLALSELFMSMCFEMERNQMISTLGKKVILTTVVTNFLSAFGTRQGINPAIDHNSIGVQSEFIHSTSISSTLACVHGFRWAWGNTSLWPKRETGMKHTLPLTSAQLLL